MKKTFALVAALCGCAGSAWAQSSVTLYGRVDEALVYVDPGRKGSAASGSRRGKGVIKLIDGVVGPSRIGLKGSEDLGDGLRAYFQLEAGLSADTGAAGGATVSNPSGSFFNRTSYIALGSKTLGDVRFGRLETLTREAAISINDVSTDGELSIFQEVASDRPFFQNFGRRIDNGITYKTPVISGFQGSAIVGLSERVAFTGAAGGVSRVAEYRGVGVTYITAPIGADLIYEEYSGGGLSGSYNKVVTVGGKYDFGIATVVAAYQNTSDFGAQLTAVGSGKGVDHEAYNIGVQIPYGKFGFNIQFTGSSIDRPGNQRSLNQNRFGASFGYSFSTRTALYGGIQQFNGTDSEAYGARRLYGLGLAHTF